MQDVYATADGEMQGVSRGTHMAFVIVAVAVGVEVANHGCQRIPHCGAVGKQARPAGGCGTTQLAFSFAYFHFYTKKGEKIKIVYSQFYLEKDMYLI